MIHKHGGTRILRSKGSEGIGVVVAACISRTSKRAALVSGWTPEAAGGAAVWGRCWERRKPPVRTAGTCIPPRLRCSTPDFEPGRPLTVRGNRTCRRTSCRVL